LTSIATSARSGSTATASISSVANASEIGAGLSLPLAERVSDLR
jgi:hypothetical protein